jgi:opacity protein-like surface antigen
MRASIIIVSTALLVSLVSPAPAQVKIAVGARAGLNLGSVSYDPDVPSGVTKGMRTGFYFGGAFELAFGGPIAIEIDPMFIMKGNVIEGEAVDGFGQPLGKAKSTTKVSFLEMPILIKGKIPTGGPITPVIFAGPSIGFKMSATNTFEVAGQTQDTDLKDQIKSTDFGLQLGGGVEFAATRQVHVAADVRYGLGLTNLAKEVAGAAQQQTAKTRGLMFGVGVLFSL